MRGLWIRFDWRIDLNRHGAVRKRPDEPLTAWPLSSDLARKAGKKLLGVGIHGMDFVLLGGASTEVGCDA